jgi:hypothetical protein
MTTIIDSNSEQRKTKKTSQMEENTETMMSKSMTKTTYKTGKMSSTQNTSTQSPQVLFEKMVEKFMANKPYEKQIDMNHELEVRFGTRGIKPLTKIDYNNVIQKLKSLGFSSANEEGAYMLRIQSEFLDPVTGTFKISNNIRTEIRGFQLIQDYCKDNDLNKILKSDYYSGNNVEFHKKSLYKTETDSYFPVNFDDFNFRVSYQTEERMRSSNPIIRSLTESWEKSKKVFRFINRVSFSHPDIPIMVDLSIVKNSTAIIMNNGKKFMKPVYTTAESGVFENAEVYEVELEVNNSKVGPGTPYNNPAALLAGIRKAIKFVLMGLQGTNYPISYPEQNNILHEYMKMIHVENYNPDKRIYTSDFIGPSSNTLQLENVLPVNKNTTNFISICKDYCVTEKADGERHMMYISKKGKIYLINNRMKLIFTGAETENNDTFHSLLDGEIVLHDKNGKFINLYAAFDIYFKNGVDVRKYGFIPKSEEELKTKYRLPILSNLIKELKPHFIITGQSQNSKEKTVKKELGLSPVRIECKKFYSSSTSTKNVNGPITIFNLCKTILEKEKEGLFEYNTDGLIFTPENMGVGANKIGEAGPLKKITWDYSFKWKPPQYNTIDFLVTTEKENGVDMVTTIFQEGTNTNNMNQLNQYKTLVLRCGFNERKDGFLNPYQDMLDDKLPSFSQSGSRLENEKEYLPVRFYPTSPPDPMAGICNIMLDKDETGVYQMFTEEREVFSDNTIVEFRYEIDNKSTWRWIPLRVRYDKTEELRQGMPNFGNAFHVANSNWYSIHNPVTDEMISTGNHIPVEMVDEDVYYNRVGVKSQLTVGLRDFHNLFVKKTLIVGASKKGNTLIDYACGKGGDFPKWIKANLSFVFGIDISKDNLENRIDGACARYLNYKKTIKYVPDALFVNGNSSANIRSGAAMLNDKAIQITRAVFGDGPKNEEKLGKGVYKQYGKGDDGFNVSSCQFALHYFFENQVTFQNFMRNVAECTKLGGYFIGTCYDGKSIFNMLKNKHFGESVEIYNGDNKVWEVIKEYDDEEFLDDVTSLGYQINVYQESINKMFPEYLVNFDYMERIMENYGFKLLTRDEAKEHGLPNGSGMFNELFILMEEEAKRNRSTLKQNEYGDALHMNSYEKKISFLNRYFIYKKIATVNAEKISIEMIEEGIDEKQKSRSSSLNKSSSLSSSSSSSSSKKTKAPKGLNASKATTEIKAKSKKNGTSKITSSKPKIQKLNKVLILDDTNEIIQSEPVTNMDLEKSLIEKELTFRPNTNSGKKEKKQTLLIDETSVIDNTALPIVTLTKEEPEMMTNVNTETRAITETKVIPEEEVVVYESKKHPNKYYIMDKDTNKPQWIQLLQDKKYPSGYYYTDTDRQQNVGIDKLVVNKD